MSPEELELWIVPCVERLGAEPCDAMHFAEDVRRKVEVMLSESREECATVAETYEYEPSNYPKTIRITDYFKYIAAAIRARSSHD